MPIGTYPLQPASANQSTLANQLEQQGANPNNAAEAAFLQAILNNGANGATSGANFQTSAGTTITLTNLSGLVQRLTAASAVTVTFDNALNIVANLPGPYLGMQWPFQIVVSNASGSVATPTVTSTGVTLSGTTSVAASTTRFYQGVITQLVTTVGYVAGSNATWTSLTQIGTSNLYTVALGANSGATPTPGTAIFLSGITGTLPAGWYPIMSAASATSFVIGAPLNSSAWTATAVTTIGTQSAAPNVLAPTITITGMWAVATATA